MNTFELLALQDKESVKNSYYRSPRVAPHIQQISDSQIEVKTIEESTIISRVEEVILYILSSFKFIPVWLIQQWIDNSYDIITSWINVGLTWAETTSMGVFLRPTRFLLDMFKIEDDKYIEIPFGMLNHTCSEEQILFDIMLGHEQSELWQIIKEEETLPCYHPLHLKFEDEQGTIAIREADFRIGFKRYSTEEILKKEEEIQREVRAEVKYSSEFSEFDRFPIVTFNDNKEVVTQTPDIIIPIPRDRGKAKSFAIEIELSPKTADKYVNIMKNYKDNIKFGKLFYLIGSQRIAKLIKDAYKYVGGLGQCELFLVPFVPPQQKLSNYSKESEIYQQDLLKNTLRSTN